MNEPVFCSLYASFCGNTVQSSDGMQVGNSDDMQLSVVYVPTNHVYVGDIFMLEDKDIIRTNMTVREGLGEYTHIRLCMFQKLLKHRRKEIISLLHVPAAKPAAQ